MNSINTASLENNHNAICQLYLHVLFQDVIKSYPRNNIQETYGEILYSGINKLLSILSPTEQDSVIDLGSGLGKLVLQVFLESAVNKVTGIEVIPELHEQASLAAQKMQRDLAQFYPKEKKLTFILGDFLKISLGNATIAFICSVCYSQKTLLALRKILDDASHVHTILTLRPIPFETFTFIKAVRIECSWDSALCYMYKKTFRL